MGWLFPGFLAGAAAIGVPIALHLLRRRPRRPAVFPSLRFLASSSRRTEHWLQRLQRWLVLALRCAIFLLLAAAFARPFRANLRGRQTRAVVVVVDNSFSMQASGRWKNARDWAVKRVGLLGAGDRLGILAMAPQPTWLIAPTTDVARPIRLLQTLAPGWLSARTEPALRLAGDTLAAIHADRREIVVMSDNQRASWSGTDFAKPLPPGIEVSFPDVPPALERQAALSAPDLARAKDGLVASLIVRNFTGKERRELRVFLNDSATPIREETLDLQPAETRTVTLHLAVPTDRSSYFRFALDSDDLPADDTAYAVWQPAANSAILIDPPPVGATADFVATALAATERIPPALKTGVLPNGAWPNRSVLLLRSDDSFSGAAAAKLNAFLAGGGGALLFATGGPEETAWLASHGITLSDLPARTPAWKITDWAMDEPLIGSLTARRIGVVLGWEFRKAWSMPIDAVTPLAYWSEDEAAIAQARVGAGTLVICGFMPDRTGGDWPVNPAFVPFLHQAAAYLYRAVQSAQAQGRTGQALQLGGQSGTWRSIAGPAAHGPTMTVADAVVPMAPGVYDFTHDGEHRLVAVNLPAEESDPASWTEGRPWLSLISKSKPRTPDNAAAELGAKLAAIDAEQQSPLWWWVFAAMGLFLLAELALANRTAR